MDPKLMRDSNSSGVIVTKFLRLKNTPAVNYISPGIISKPLYKKFVPLNETNVWYRNTKVSEPTTNVEIPKEEEKEEETSQTGAGLQTAKDEIASLTTEDIINKMKNPSCANIVKISESKGESNDSESVPLKKRKIVKPKGKTEEDWEDFKFY